MRFRGAVTTTSQSGYKPSFGIRQQSQHAYGEEACHPRGSKQKGVVLKFKDGSSAAVGRAPRHNGARDLDQGADEVS